MIDTYGDGQEKTLPKKRNVIFDGQKKGFQKKKTNSLGIFGRVFTHEINWNPLAYIV